MVDRKMSLVITTYERTDMTANAFKNVIDDGRISEVIIVDDCSKPRTVAKLQSLCTHPKIKLFFNQQNLGCYKNKKYAISKANEEYVLILDSDNTIDKSFIDKLCCMDWRPDTVLAPDFAKPHFNYTVFSNLILSKSNVGKYIPTASKTRFDCLINTMNYFVNRDEYLRVWDGSIEPWTADTIFQNYNWLKAGNKIHVVEGLQYDHLVHNGSHYQEHNSKTGNLYKEIENKLMRL
jgi:glycosyltransferase involved in cell wall biosynthesis